jgi:type I restriction enzyme R subunit
MYVDKVLGGVAAVQTLSRLNRIHPGKVDTMVLDFSNTAEDIEESFAPFYKTTILSESTNPNKLYDLQRTLEDFHLYSESEVATIAELFLRQGESASTLQPLLMAVVRRFAQIDDPKHAADFKHQLRSYVRLYAFLSQVIPFRDRDLERLYLFARLLIHKLPIQNDDLPSEALESVDLESYRIQQLSTGAIALESSDNPLDPLGDLSSSRITQAEWTTLASIIADLNDRFGTDFTEADRVFFAELKTRLVDHESLQASARVNARDNVQLLHDSVFNQILTSMIEKNFDMFKRINDDPAFGAAIRARLFDLVYKELTKDTAPLTQEPHP